MRVRERLSNDYDGKGDCKWRLSIMIPFQMDVNNDKELTLKEFVDGCLADKELFQILTNEVKK